MALITIPKKFAKKQAKKRHIDIPLELSKSKNKGRNMKNPDPTGRKSYKAEDKLINRLVKEGDKKEQMPADTEDLSPLIHPKTGLLYKK